MNFSIKGQFDPLELISRGIFYICEGNFYHHLKGLVHPKMKILSLITHPHVVPKPVIFGIQIKIFLIKTESSLTLHRQQCNCNVPRSRNVVRTLVKQSMWHQWLNFNFAKLREYFLCAKKTKIMTLFNNSSPSSYCLPPFWRVSQRIRMLYPKRKRRWLRRFMRALYPPPPNENNSNYIDYVLGYSPKWCKT